MEIRDEEYHEFMAWKRAKNRNELDVAFDALEDAMNHPSGRQFNAIMPSLAYRTLADAILALKKELIP